MPRGRCRILRVRRMTVRLVLSLAAGVTGGLSATAEERDTGGQSVRGTWPLPAAIRPTLDTNGYRLYTLGFEPETDDRDLNRRPDADRWERVRGTGYPFYCRCVLDTDRPHRGRNALRLEPDGASAALRTLPLPVSRFHTYEVNGWIRTRGLTRARARIEIEFLTEDGRTVLAHGHTGGSSVREQIPRKTASPAPVREPLQGVLRRDRSAPLGGTADWRACRFVARPPQALALRWMRLRLGVEAGPTGSDIHAAAWFDSITIREQPRPALRTSEPANLFLSHQPKSVTLLLSGLKAEHAPARLILTDIRDREVLTTEATLAAEAEKTTVCRFAFDLKRPGLYRATVTVGPPASPLVTRHVWLAVAPRESRCNESTLPLTGVAGTHTLGLTLSPGPTPHGLTKLLDRIGCRLVKVPIQSMPGADSPDALIRELAEQGTTCVGVLTGRGVLANGHAGGSAVRGRVLPKAASPAPVRQPLRGVLDSADTVGREQLALAIAQYGGRIAAWQLGDDTDRSLCEAPDLARVLAHGHTGASAFTRGLARKAAPPAPVRQPLRGVLKHLAESAGPLIEDLPIAVAWSALYRRPTAAAGLRAVNIDIGPEVPPENIPSQVGTDGIPFWATIHPLDRSLFGREARLRDLVLRVVYARQAGARRVFLAPLVDDRFGLLREDGSPTETLLVWRTLTEMLDGLPYLGHVPLPGGTPSRGSRTGAGDAALGGICSRRQEPPAWPCASTPNALFGTGTQAVLVVWSPDGERRVPLAACPPVQGNRTRAGKPPVAPEQIDLLGRRRPLTTINGEVAVTVGPMPVFVTGVDAGLAATCASLRLGPARPERERGLTPSVKGSDPSSASSDSTPVHLESEYRWHVRTVRFTNRFDRRIRGWLSLSPPEGYRRTGATGGLSASAREQDTGGQSARGTRAPPSEGWRLEPRVMPFDLAAGADFERRVRILFPYSTACGTRMLRARWRIETDRRLRASTEVPVRIGLTGVAMWTDVLRTPDGNAVLRLRLENSSSGRLRVSCYVTVAGVLAHRHVGGSVVRGQGSPKAASPGPARQPLRGVETVRSGIFQVPAGEQAERRYVLGRAERLAGHTVRISLRELGGKRFLNREVLILPRAPEWTALEPADGMSGAVVPGAPRP